MNKKSNHNSIVFLTTLSVYLGLVLVGGTAPVLAHSALTRSFDIKNEIIFEDDLDKKPDDEVIENYFENLEYFIVDLRKLYGIEKFNLNSYNSNFRYVRNKFTPCDENESPRGFYDFDESKQIENLWVIGAIEDVSNDLEYWNNFSDCISNVKYGKDKVKISSTQIVYDKSDLIAKISADKKSSHSAEQLVENLNQALKLYKVNEENIIVKELYLNTNFSSENNQVFIVTRLPRASIDALLAEKDAQ